MTPCSVRVLWCTQAADVFCWQKQQSSEPSACLQPNSAMLDAARDMLAREARACVDSVMFNMLKGGPGPDELARLWTLHGRQVPDAQTGLRPFLFVNGTVLPVPEELCFETVLKKMHKFNLAQGDVNLLQVRGAVEPGEPHT